MAFKHTGKYWRLKCSATLIRARPNRKKRKVKSSKVLVKDPEVNSLLVTIFSKAKSKIAPSISVIPDLTYVVYEYDSDKKKLEFSLSLKGCFVRIGEIFDQLQIIDTLKDLSLELIPKWSLDILNHYRFSVKSGLCLANFVLIEGKRIQSVFNILFITREKSDTKRHSPIKEYKLSLTEGQSTDSVYSVLQSCSTLRENPLSCASTTVCPDLKSLKSVQSSSLVKDAINKQVLERLSLLGKLKIEIFFKNFLRNRPVKSELFTFSCIDEHGIPLNTRFYACSQNERYKGDLVENVTDISETPANCTNSIKFETSQALNEYICQLFDNILLTLKDVTLFYQLSEDNEIHRLIELKVLGDTSENNMEISQEHSQEAMNETESATVSRIGDVSVTLNDLKTLRQNCWLNDKVIGAYLNLIAERSQRLLGILPKVYVFNSFFLSSLQRGLINLKRYSKKNIHLHDLLFVPFNYESVHWTLFCVNIKSRTVLFYDSLATSKVPSEADILCKFLVNIEDLFVNENRPKELKKKILPYNSKLGKCLRQSNYYDCGVFTIILAEYISRRERPTYTQEQMDSLRIQVAYELVTKKLSAPLKVIQPKDFPELSDHPVDLGYIEGDLRTLTFNFALQETVMTKYFDFLKRKFGMYIYPGPTNVTQYIFVFPFRNKDCWAVIIVNKTSKQLYYYNIEAPNQQKDQIYSTVQSYFEDDILSFNKQKLAFPVDSIDSGVYVLSAAYAAANGLDFDLGEKNISYLRAKIYLELIDKMG